MSYAAILFDMDGTLLPMDMDNFTKSYFKLLYAKLAKHGLDAKSFGANMWQGVSAMVKNDGSMTNEDAFWKKFCVLTGLPKEVLNADCLAFYGGDFHAAKAFTGENPLAVEAVKAAHEKAPIVALATNPLFPMCGQVTRMSWVGLAPKDFDLVTSYEEDTFCKPNPQYYLSVCRRLGVKPEECLMIGNSEGEDMASAASVGMDCYLVTDWMIADPDHPWQGPKGTFAEMVAMLKALDR